MIGSLQTPPAIMQYGGSRHIAHCAAEALRASRRRREALKRIRFFSELLLENLMLREEVPGSSPITPRLQRPSQGEGQPRTKLVDGPVRTFDAPGASQERPYSLCKPGLQGDCCMDVTSLTPSCRSASRQSSPQSPLRVRVVQLGSGSSRTLANAPAGTQGAPDLIEAGRELSVAAGEGRRRRRSGSSLRAT